LKKKSKEKLQPFITLEKFEKNRREKYLIFFFIELIISVKKKNREKKVKKINNNFSDFFKGGNLINYSCKK
jgi:hypothetical protein